MAFSLRDQGSQALLFLIVLGIGAGIAYYAFLLPMQQEIEQATQQSVQLQAQIEQMQAIERKLPQYIREIEVQKKRLEQLKSSLPDEKETATIIRRVQGFAVSSSIIIRTFRPQESAQRDFYTEWPIQMEFNGSYHSLGLFFEKISRYARIINVTNLNIKRIPDSEDASQTLTASCTSTTFVYR
jgi:type IV pilus assembly protein PilO